MRRVRRDKMCHAQRRPACPRKSPGAEGPAAGLCFPESVRAILAARTPDGEAEEALRALGLEPTVLNAIHWGMSGKAARGDTSAAKYLRDAVEREGEEDAPEPEWPELSTLSDRELRALAARLEEAEGR